MSLKSIFERHGHSVTQVLRLPADAAHAARPNVMLMGRDRAGKTSIMQVIARKMQDFQTENLPLTTNIQLYESPFINVWDIPSQVAGSLLDKANVWCEVGAIIFVLASEISLTEDFDFILKVITAIRKFNSKPRIHIFCHKADHNALDEDHYLEYVDCFDKHFERHGTPRGIVNTKYTTHRTSIVDHTTHIALSQIAQSMDPRRVTFERILNTVCENPHVYQTFLIDTQLPLYVAKDDSPLDMDTYGFCLDMMFAAKDIASLFSSDAPDGRSNMSFARLGDGKAYALWPVDKTMAMMCVFNSMVTMEEANAFADNTRHCMTSLRSAVNRR
ncbi:Gtr1/RagA G protein conserved region-domain-containing protein [Gamsiella multidivaricata]|uniref:Gtr1/RagA G protein conserved region-domain-containing protein n=1 Tax=Gamsiella multidivaricata TaxID=101098 RepID=UPI0022212577|nr:Gtr1/RagA G protein conserved region-domain-containing protein [Gamsiella multidivaricata]KAG0370639.1 hypothetical protein BGZ54_005149 [Gamsiella multidivaricata]KAI7822584.1 Gtr1/RagA G protein conserved region-domain-containing protein [Gamsiella multidivaricata]